MEWPVKQSGLFGSKITKNRHIGPLSLWRGCFLIGTLQLRKAATWKSEPFSPPSEPKSQPAATLGPSATRALRHGRRSHGGPGGSRGKEVSMLERNTRLLGTLVLALVLALSAARPGTAAVGAHGTRAAAAPRAGLFESVWSRLAAWW